MEHWLKMGQVWNPEAHGTEQTFPALPGARSTACQSQSCFPRWAVPKPGYTSSPLNHFSLLLLNNLSPFRQNGSTGSPTFLELMHNLQSDARLPRTGRTERLGHLPKSRKEGISWSREKKQLCGSMCLWNKGTCWIVSSQGKGKAV